MVKISRHIPLILLPGVLCYSIVVLATLSPIWQLMLLGGIVSGITANTKKIHILSSTIGTFCGWFTYIILKIVRNQSYQTLDQIGQIIIGSSGRGWIFLILILGVGTLLGYVSSVLSYNVKTMIQERKKPKEIDDAV